MMRHAFVAVLVAAGAIVNAQTTTTSSPEDVLESLLASASSQLSIAESSYSTTNEAFRSIYSQASSQISAAIESLGTGTAAADEYSSIAADFSSAFGGPPDYSEITLTGSALSTAIAADSSDLASLSTDIASEISEAVSTNPVATYTANIADQVQVGAFGAAGAVVLGLAAFL